MRLYPVKEQLAPPPDIHLTELQSFNEAATAVASQIEAIPEQQTTAKHHFSVNINLAWSKLNEYYSMLDNTPVYMAAVVLHPRFKWKWLEKAWNERLEWLGAARKSFNSLLIDYELQAAKPQTPPQKPRSLDIDLESSEDEMEELNIHQQLSDYLRERSSKDHVPTKRHSSIPYWKAKQFNWPYLAALALDIYAIAVMLDEPERVFSITGAAIGQRRRLMSGDKIGYLMCLKAWSQSKVI